MIPIVQALKQNFPEALISIDTYKALVAEEALKAGARNAGAHQRGLACGVRAMYGKDVLGEIDADGDNGRHGLPLPKNE